MAYSEALTKEEQTRLAKEKVEKSLAKVRTDVVSVFDNDSMPRFLGFMSKFHYFDVYNLLLIYKQYPTATFIAPFNLWKQLSLNHRHDPSWSVLLGNQKGKGIGVLAPYILKKKILESSDSSAGAMRPRIVSYLDYHIVFLFDKTQVNGIPAPVIEWDLSKDAFDAEAAFHAFKEAASFNIVFSTTPGFKGNYVFEEAGQRAGMKDTLELNPKYLGDYFTLCNFIVRVFVSDFLKKIKDRYSPDELEKITECVAYVLASYLGLSVDGYNFFFVESWTDSPKKMLDLLSIICQAAHSLIENLEEKIIEYKVLFGHIDDAYADDDILEFDSLFTF